MASYIAGMCGRAIVVFRADERPEFYRAHRSKMAMRIFMSDKIREATRGPDGSVLERQSIGSFADIYEGLVIERHGLIEKQNEWREAEKAGRSRWRSM